MSDSADGTAALFHHGQDDVFHTQRSRPATPSRSSAFVRSDPNREVRCICPELRLALELAALLPNLFCSLPDGSRGETPACSNKELATLGPAPTAP